MYKYTPEKTVIEMVKTTLTKNCRHQKNISTKNNKKLYKVLKKFKIDINYKPITSSFLVLFCHQL